MRKDENGSILIETIGSFILFVFLVVAILSLINIVAVQARIHFALTQTAETVSMYSYVLHVTGADSHMQASAAQAESLQVDANTFKSGLNQLFSGVEALNPEQVYQSGSALYDQASGWVNDTISDPQKTLQIVLNFGLNELGSAAFEAAVVQPLMEHHLQNGKMSASQFLKAFNVDGDIDGLDYYRFGLFDLNDTGANNSHLMTSDGDVKIVVQYDVNYAFLDLPFTTLHVTQEVMTKSWLGGNGKGYS